MLNFGISREDVRRELEVIREVCVSGQENIVQVYHQNRFRTLQVYYFDMELCCMNLSQYIHRDRNLLFGQGRAFTNDSFVPNDCSTRLKTSNLWTIASHISLGLKFIHGKRYTHRDLKPHNGNEF